MNGQLACPGCPELVPLVSKPFAQRIALGLSLLGRSDPRGRTTAQLDVLEKCLYWLVEPLPGLQYVRGILGRAYTRAEKDKIALEQHVIERLPCPFAVRGGCMLGGQGTAGECLKDELGVGPWGWLPALLASAIDQKSVRAIAERGLVADAKLALLNRRHSFPVRSSGGLAVASTLPEQKQEAVHGSLPGVISQHPH